ncbi:MAG TPA: hypothetical protein VGH28_14055 [Polyangiaceae bacterium]|jgi:hypothetical protein
MGKAIRSAVGAVGLNKAKGEHAQRPTSKTATRFRIRTTSGAIVEGPVQGSGGVIASIARLHAAQRCAVAGRPTGLYEPESGCVAVYPEFNAWSNAPTSETIVSLVGAAIEAVS